MFNSILEVLQIQHLDFFLKHVWHLKALMQLLFINSNLEIGRGCFFFKFLMKTFKHASCFDFFFQISLLVNIKNGLGLGSPVWPL